MSSPESLDSSLLARLLADQERRWGGGECVLVEAYLKEHPSLAEDATALLALVAGERRLRLARGDEPSLEEYLSRFPAWEATLREGWPALASPQARTPPPLFPDLETAPEKERPIPAAPELPEHELLRVIGRGGMGVVYEGRQRGLRRRCAVKLIKSGELASPEEVIRFRTEAAAIGRIEHPGVVRVFAYGEHAGTLYLVMEYLPGGTLAGLLTRGGPLPPRQAAQMVHRLAEAVQAAHEAGIIHRDLKPANVLLAADDTPKVTDFGLARLAEQKEALTQTGATLGTPGYAAPEQARGSSGGVGPAADVWGLGAVLYACLTGRPPFRGRDGWEILRSTCEDDPEPIRAGRADVDEALEAVCLKCLEKEPARRFASAGALAADLARWLKGERPEARPAGRLGRAARWARRRPRRVFLAALLGAAPFVAAGGYFLWGRTKPSPPSPVELLDRELAQGGGAELFDDQGRPRDGRILIGAEGSTPTAWDGAFAVQSTTYCLLRLAADPGADRFEYRVDVRHHRNVGNTVVGLFVAFVSLAADGGRTANGYLTVGFDDHLCRGLLWDRRVAALGGPPPGERRWRNQLELCGYVNAGRGWEDRKVMRFGHRAPEKFVASRSGAGVWRRLRVRVSPAEVQTFWGEEDEPASRVRAEDLVAEHRRYDALLPASDGAKGFEYAFAPRGAIGLFVQAGVASFRDARLLPW
jgi:serine/threonine-protein kinase